LFDIYYDLCMSFLKVELDVQVSTTRFYSFTDRNSRWYLHSHSVGKFFYRWAHGFVQPSHNSYLESFKKSKNLIASALGSSSIIEYWPT